MNLRQSQAQFAPAPQFAKGIVRARGAKREGLRYQAIVEEYLRRELGTAHLQLGPWIKYNGCEYRQPDAVYFDRIRGIVVEIKLRHCFEAWQKLRQIYQPLVEGIYKYKFSVLEICHHFNPEVDLPEAVLHISSIHDMRSGCFNVLTYHPKLGALPCPTP